MSSDQSARWDKVYGTKTEILPWTNIIFSDLVHEYLNSLNKNELLLVPGCGRGETVNRLYMEGFRNVVGTDISTEAITQARELFPRLDFRVIATEDLKNYKEFFGCNVFDWLNLHQISPSDFESYLSSLGTIGKTLCMSWIFHEGIEKLRSYVHDGEVYFHNPQTVFGIINSESLTLKEESAFTFKANISEKDTTHSAVTQVYAKS